jgi:porin
MIRYYVAVAFLILAGVALGAAPAKAQQEAKSKSIWQQDTLTGDWSGERTFLKDKGIDIDITSVDEVFDVLSGGVRRQATYEGQLGFTVDADLAKLIGWKGATTHVTVFDIRDSGRNVIQNTGSISDPSNIDALSNVRLYDAWYQQEIGDRLTIRVGQILADGEFMTAPSAAGLLNGTFGWDDLLGANMLNGGPAYPLAVPGAMVEAKLTDALKVKSAVYSGNSAGSGCTKQPQECDLYGTTFSTSGGALVMSELQYAVNQGKDAVGLPGTYKLGGWFASADFNDLHFGTTNGGALVSLGSDPSAAPLKHSGDGGLYAVADQMVWRGKEQSLNLFLRGGYAPSDRNLVSYYVDGGAAFKGPFEGRAEDILTFAVAYAKISPDAAVADRDASAAVRDYETVFELDYSARIAPWWTIQPDVQYIIHPNGGQNPNDPTQRIGNAFVTGLRSTVKF